jgi:hypothetical protein
MSNENHAMSYMMAAEKMINLIFTIENTLIFMQEYEIKPDDEVKKALKPLLINLENWLEPKSK